MSPVVSTSETMDNGASSDTGVSLTGTYPSYFPAEDDTLSAGAYFTQQEVNTAQDVVVLGSEAATDLFGTASPVGKSVLVAGIPFTVVGVLAAKARAAGEAGIIGGEGNLSSRYSRITVESKIVCPSWTSAGTSRRGLSSASSRRKTARARP